MHKAANRNVKQKKFTENLHSQQIISIALLMHLNYDQDVSMILYLSNKSIDYLIIKLCFYNICRLMINQDLVQNDFLN